MVTPSFLRSSSLVLAFALLARMASEAEDEGGAKSVQYKRADANLYARGDVLKAEPAAAILPSTAFAQNGDTYTYTPEKKAPRTVYLESPADWVEPITPPDMPASLAIAPDAMEIREMQGDVQVAMPNAPTSFSPASNGLSLPNGAVVKTGPGATAAVLFGGVDSARLMPNSEAAVQQAVASTSRAAEVDLTAGGVFCKVGTQVGVGNDFQVHTPFGTALTTAGDFVAYSTSDRTDIWVEQGTVDLLQPDGKKFGSATGVGSGPLKLIRFPAINDPVRAQKADAESLTAILNFLPMANQKLAVLHAKAAQNVALTPNEQAYLARIKQVPALIKLALIVPPPSELTVLADGTVGFQGQTLSMAELNARLKDFAATTYDPSVVLMAGTGATYANFEAAKKACQDAAVAHVTTEGPVPAAPPPPPAPQDVVVIANGMVKLNGAPLKIDEFTTRLKALVATAPDVAVTVHAEPKASFRDLNVVINTCKSAPVKNLTVDLPPLKELTVSAHADGTIGFHGAKLKLEELGDELQAAVALYPDLPIVLHSNPSMDYAKFKAVSDACSAAGAKQVTVVQPAPKPPAPIPAPAPVVAATPPAPAPALALTPPAPLAPPKPPKPAPVIAHADGTIKFQGKTMKIDEFTAAIKDAAAANPDLAVILHSNPKMDYAKFQAVLDACNNAPIKNVTVVQPAPKPAPAPAPAIVEAPPTPAPATAVTPPPPAPVPVNTAPVPAEIDLAVDGSLTLDGAAVSEDELKDKLGDIKKTNPKNPLVMMKQHGVTKAQWMHYVDLCHSIGLKLLVKNAKVTAVASTPDTAMERPAAAEGGPIAEPPPMPPMPAPHLSAAPAPAPEDTGSATIASATPAPAISSSEEAVPVEIELTPDGQVSFLGEAISESELRSRLESVAHSNSREPVLIVKDEKVSHSQWQHIVDLCHSVKLKVNLKTVKSSDSTGLKPRVQPAVALVPPPAAGDDGARADGAKILPVEIDLARQGRMTFEGDSVNLDELKGRLATIAQGNPDQPVVIVRENGVSDDSADALVTVCQGVSPRLKVSVKAAPAFTPSFPDNSPAANLPAPTVHMHASLDALSNSTASSP